MSQDPTPEQRRNAMLVLIQRAPHADKLASISDQHLMADLILKGVDDSVDSLLRNIQNAQQAFDKPTSVLLMFPLVLALAQEQMRFTMEEMRDEVLAMVNRR